MKNYTHTVMKCTIISMKSSKSTIKKTVVLILLLLFSFINIIPTLAQSSNTDYIYHTNYTIFTKEAYDYYIYNSISEDGYFMYIPEIGFGENCFAVCEGYSGSIKDDPESPYYRSDKENISILSKVPMIEEVITSDYKKMMINRGYCPVLFYSGFFNDEAKNITFPPNIKEIFFYGLPEKVLSVNLPTNIKSITSPFLLDMDSIKSIHIPQNVELINSGAIMYCKSLKYIYLPDKLKEIKNDNFKYLPSLEAIKIPDNVEIIGQSCFYDCPNLKRVYIGKKVKIIDYYCFFGCENITEITCMAKEPPLLPYSFDREVYEKATLTVPEGSKEKYMKAPGWKDFFIRDGSMSIQAYKGHLVHGQQATGVTADGESQLKFEVSFKDNDFKVKSYEMTLFVNGEETELPIITGSFNDFGIQDDGKWGFIYTAPQSYPEDIYDESYEVTVNLKLKNNTNKEVNVSRIITVSRPGVILLHGFNSNPSYLKDLQSHLVANMYFPWQVYNVNYSPYHHSSLNIIQEKKVVEDAIDDLSLSMLNLNGIVSSKYDIIGHSMGGLVARKFSQSEKNALVNRLITLNTPNYGSELADFGVDYLIPGITKAASTVSGLVFRNLVLGRVLNYVLNKAFNYMISPNGPFAAIDALQTKSSAIQDINNPSNMIMADGTPVHAVCSYLVDEGSMQTLNALNPKFEFNNSFEGLLSFYNMLYKWTGESTPTGELLLAYIFDGFNDGIVSYNSQKGGLADNKITTMVDVYSGIFGTDSWAHHNKTNHWYDTLSEISTLLCMSPKSSCYARSFVPLYPAFTPKRMPRADVEFKEASDSTFLHLSVIKSESERVLNVHIDKSSDIEYSMVFSFLDENKMLLGTDSTDYVFKIPDEYRGTIEVCALGRTHDFALVADTALVQFNRISDPLYLYFDGPRNKTMIKGQSLIPNVLIGWSLGATDYIVPSYTCTADGIFNLTDGVITATSEGECDLIANYEGLSDTLHVNVIDPLSLDAIRNIDLCNSKTQCTLDYNNNYLYITFDKPYEGTIEVNVFDVIGKKYLTQTKNLNFISNERICIDLSELKSQIYFVNLVTKDGVSNLKIVK
ncbi:MAG: leucine-rich repeat protein [Prevotella sp.]|nr:leucine-rich repeat protein [Prevotella sp.]